tara:strand:+ start:146 stop:322 length:177 start_codon:yes stop_codon:yes gene_type:complete
MRVVKAPSGTALRFNENIELKRSNKAIFMLFIIFSQVFIKIKKEKIAFLYQIISIFFE